MSKPAVYMGFIILMCLALAACAPRGSLISRERAISIGLGIASSSAPEISGSLVPPTHVEAQQLTLWDAMQALRGSPSGPQSGDTLPPRGYTWEAPVWYVTLDGLWASEAAAPGLTTTQQPYHQYRIVLDAVTGAQIAGSLRP